MSNGDSDIFDVGGLTGGIIDLAGLVLQAIIDFLNALVAAIVQVVNFLYAGELGIFGFADSGLVSIFKGLRNLMDQIFKVWVAHALAHLLSLFEKLQAWVRKLKAWLEKWRRLQQLYQVQALKRAINLIQRIRQMLIIFRVLHLKFAQKLDAWLAGIEGKLVLRTVQMQAKTNEIIAWLNLILDPVHGLSHLPAFLALTKSADPLLKVFTGHGIDFWYSKPIAGGVTLPPPITYKQHYAQLGDELATGSGDVAVWRSHFAAFQELMKQVS